MRSQEGGQLRHRIPKEDLPVCRRGSRGEMSARLMAGGAEQQLLDTLLRQFKERGWLKERGKQRTDSTHVLAAIRNLNRLEGVGETLGNE